MPHGTTLLLRHAGQQIETCADFLAFGSNLQRGLGGKAFRKVARARHHDREAMRPSLEDDHRKPLTDRRQNKGVRGGEGGTFFGAE